MRDINLSDYMKISAKERISLTVAAMAREDFKEADRLYSTCPKHKYTINDIEYNCRLMALPLLKLCFIQNCVYFYNLLIKIDHSILMTEVLDTTKDDQKVYESLNLRRVMHVSKLKALFAGFLDFCDQSELDGRELIELMGISDYCFNIDKYLNYGILTDQEYLDTVKQEFQSCWPFN